MRGGWSWFLAGGGGVGVEFEGLSSRGGSFEDGLRRCGWTVRARRLKS